MFCRSEERPDVQPPLPLPFVPMPAENRTRSSEESDDLAQVSRGKSAASKTPTQRRGIFIFGWRAYASSPSWPGPCNSAVRLEEITIPKCHPSYTTATLKTKGVLEVNVAKKGGGIHSDSEWFMVSSLKRFKERIV